MSYPKQSYPHSELTEQIIASAYRVGNELKNGLNEKLYENALCIDFASHSLSFSQQKQFPVYYLNKLCGTLIPDLIVENKVIVDTKVVKEINNEHIAQMQSYLNITGLKVGLLINFKYTSVNVRRVAKTLSDNSEINLAK